EGAFLLMADIEDATTGEQGKVRQWLARALRAPRDPAWVADGYISERWAPFSPVTGRLDALVWKVPVERAAQMIEQEDADHPSPDLTLPAIAPDPEMPAPPADPDVTPPPPTLAQEPPSTE